MNSDTLVYIVYHVQNVFKCLKVNDTDTHYHYDPFVDVTEHDIL